MERNLDLLLHGPIFPLVTGTIGVTLYWVLRIRARQTASYRALATEFGEPGRIERLFVGGVILALYVLLAYRSVAFLVGASS